MNSIAKLDALAKDAGTISSICEAYAKLSLTSRKYLLDALVEYQDVPAKVKNKVVPAVAKEARRRPRKQNRVSAEDVLAALQNGPQNRQTLARSTYGSATLGNVQAISAHLTGLRLRGIVRPVGFGVWELAPQLAVAS